MSSKALTSSLGAQTLVCHRTSPVVRRRTKVCAPGTSPQELNCVSLRSQDASELVASHWRPRLLLTAAQYGLAEAHLVVALLRRGEKNWGGFATGNVLVDGP